MATLEIAANDVGTALSAEQTHRYLYQWIEMLANGRGDSPSEDAFERVRMLIIQSEKREKPNRTLNDRQSRKHPEWEIGYSNNEPVAYRKISNNEWLVPTKSREFIAFVGDKAVQQYGQDWSRLGLIRPSNDGKTTQNQRLDDGSQARCLVVPVAVLNGN